MGRVSPGGRAALPTPPQTHTGQRPASTSPDPLTQEMWQLWRVVLHKIWSGTTIEGNRRHTSAGATLPPGSVPLQVIPGMKHELMATHWSSSSPCRSCSWPIIVSLAILPYSGGGVNAPLGSREGSINPACAGLGLFGAQRIECILKHQLQRGVSQRHQGWRLLQHPGVSPPQDCL